MKTTRLLAYACAALLANLAITAPLLAGALPPIDTVPTTAQLWGLKMIHQDVALDAGLTGKGVIIGVVDDPILTTHPQFDDRIIATYGVGGYTPGIPDPDDPDDTPQHGTHVAGIIAGENVGVAPDSRIVGIKLDENDAYNASGYDYGLSQGVRIFNNSWGTEDDDKKTVTIVSVSKEQIEQSGADLLESFRRTSAAGAIQVFGAGNTPDAQPSVEAGLPYYFEEFKPYWLSVVAVGPDGLISSYSNRAGVAAEWTIAAPGGDGDVGSDNTIWSSWYTYNDGEYTANYQSIDGTSMATPYVVGAAADAMELFPRATGPEIVQLLLQTATDIGDPGVDVVYGWGLLNLANIVKTVEPRTAGLFANATWSRFVTMDQMGTALRERLDAPTPSSGEETGTQTMAIQPDKNHGATASLSGFSAAGLWLMPIYGDANLDFGNDSQSAHLTTKGAWLGTDLIAGESTRIGFAAGFSRSDLETTTSLDSGRTDAMHFGLFAHQDWDGWVLEGSGQLALLDQTLSRYEISGAAGTSRPPVGHSSFRTDGLEAAISLARKLEHGSGWSIAPYAALNWRWQKSDAFNENDANIFSLKAPQNTLYQLEPGIGLRWTSASTRTGAGDWWLTSEAGYSKLAGDIDNAFQVSLLGRPIIGQTATLGRDILTFGAQLHFATLSSGTSGFLGYRGKLQQNAKEHLFMTGIDVQF